MTQIAFTGDVAFTKHFSQACSDDNLLSEKIVKFLSSSDYTVVNVEGAVASNETRSDKPLTHANPLECVNWIKKVNGNIWNLANNHSMDCGNVGMQSTLDAAQQNGCMTVGAGMNIESAQKPIIIDAEGGIGIVAVTYFRQNKADAETPGCFVAEDEKRVKKQIKEIKKKCRWCIVVSHVGQEFSQVPMPFLRRRYKRYLKYGADIIVGHHSHVVQNYEKFGKKIVFYSLGNFIFDTDYQRIQKYTEYGMLIKINFNQEDYSWEFLPVKNNRSNSTVSESETPTIFRNINASEYGLLWPLAAKHLCLNERKKNTFHHPDFAKRSWLGWFFKFELKNCEKPQGRDIMLGRFLNLFRFWKFADEKTIQYIKERF